MKQLLRSALSPVAVSPQEFQRLTELEPFRQQLLLMSSRKIWSALAMFFRCVPDVEVSLSELVRQRDLWTFPGLPA